MDLPCDAIHAILDLLDYRSVCGLRRTCCAHKEAVRTYALKFEHGLAQFYTYSVVEQRRSSVPRLLKYAKKEPARACYRCARCGAGLRNVGDCAACTRRFVLVYAPRPFPAKKMLLWLFLCALLVAQPQPALRSAGVALWIHAVLNEQN
jgi:hypothetical protein